MGAMCALEARKPGGGGEEMRLFSGSDRQKSRETAKTLASSRERQKKRPEDSPVFCDYNLKAGAHSLACPSAALSLPPVSRAWPRTPIWQLVQRLFEAKAVSPSWQAPQ